MATKKITLNELRTLVKQIIKETYLDAQGNKTQFKGGEKVKYYNYTDRRDTGKPGEVGYAKVERVENKDGKSQVLVVRTDEKGQRFSGWVPLEDFDKHYEIVK
jgi:hypothetical protein